MAHGKAALWSLFLLLLLQGSHQQSCPASTKPGCSGSGSGCDISPSVFDGPNTIILNTAGTYRLTQSIDLGPNKVICINGSTSNAGAYILTVQSGVHFTVSGSDALLSLQGLTVQGDTSQGGITVSAAANVILSSVIYQGNPQHVSVNGAGASLTIKDSAFLNNINTAPTGGGALYAVEDSGSSAITISLAGNVRCVLNPFVLQLFKANQHTSNITCQPQLSHMTLHAVCISCSCQRLLCCISKPLAS